MLIFELIKRIDWKNKAYFIHIINPDIIYDLKKCKRRGFITQIKNETNDFILSYFHNKNDFEFAEK